MREKGILENTVIIFASDHGDYLGDHGLSGKTSYYQAACHIPLLVCHPDFQASIVSNNLVTLTDVTATILGLAGCDIPTYMDATPLSGLGLTDEGEREHIVGMLRNGWMLFDGTWKLCKYASGAHLFNLEDDPDEQHNLARDSRCADIFHCMDTQLTALKSCRRRTRRFSRNACTLSVILAVQTLVALAGIEPIRCPGMVPPEV